MTSNRSKNSVVSHPVGSHQGPAAQVDLITTDEADFNPEDYAIGEIVSGRFRVDHVIGIGSMGVVLAATHLELDEKVAIKFVRKEMQELPGVMQRFAREAKATVSLKSEHIARVFDVGTVEGVGPYIVMEYLDGLDLGKVLENEGRLSIRRAVHYVLQACEALAAAHRADITHRDMKPENLFLTQQGELELIKLLDFGISKATLTGRIFGDELSNGETACLLGTPLYMSPEQIQSTETVNYRTDIWSLGAVLYELVTGESAFVADSVSQVWHRILETEPVPIVQFCPEAPPTLQLVIDRCLAKDPNNRFENVAELAMALLPFAPSRARTYAQRSASILGIANDSIFPVAMPTSLDPRASLQFVAPPSSLTTVTVSQDRPVSAPDVNEVDEPRRRSGLAALLASIALLLGAVFVWTQGGEAYVGAEASFAPPLPVVRPAVRLESEATAKLELPAKPILEDSRQVRVKSTPSGAVVKVGGQVLGLTPLTAILPVGTRELSIGKTGYESREVLLQLDAVVAGAPPVVASVTLVKREKPSPPARARTRRRAPKVTRKAPPVSRREPARVETSSATQKVKAPSAPPKRVMDSRPKPLVDSNRPRLLLEEPSRAKILE